MEANILNGTFASTSQRVVSTYQRMLSEFCPVPVDCCTVDEQGDLHAFFHALYEALFTTPDAFGLPAAADTYLLVDHSKEGPNKTDVKKVLDKQRKLVEEGLGFLSAAACAGRIEGQTLLLAAGSPAADFLKKKPGKAWVKGMERAGLILTPAGADITLSNARFPRMIPALKALAESCARSANADLGRVFFARCDFRALRQDFSISALDLYRIFPPADFAWAVELHNFFTLRGYQAQVEIGRMFSWTVKYQGKKTVKSTPLFQIDFDERFAQQMRAGIKCASSQRIVHLLPNQSPALQTDFAARANRCGNCDWCRNSKTLGPSELVYQGETRKICWYVNSDLTVFTPDTIALVKEYAEMHEVLG
jgi:hypothetical protein